MSILIDLSSFADPTTELGVNKKVRVVIDASSWGITAADGSKLDKDISLVFYTEATPMYTSIDHVLLEGGEVLEALPDSAIYLEIYSASSQIDSMILFDPDIKFADKTTQSYLFFRRARQELARCLATRNLLRAILGSRGLNSGRRTLADFTVDLSGQANLIAQARSFASETADQCRFWLKAVHSGGARDFEFSSPRSAVKSGLNVNEPGGIGRGWLIGGKTLNSREDAVIDTQAGTKTRPRRKSKF